MATIAPVLVQQDQAIAVYDFTEFNSAEYHENMVDVFYAQLVQYANNVSIQDEYEISQMLQNNRENVSDDIRRCYDIMETHIRMAEFINLSNMEDYDVNVYFRLFEDIIEYVQTYRETLPVELYNMVMVWTGTNH
jgi:hypothetical protein